MLSVAVSSVEPERTAALWLLPHADGYRKYAALLLPPRVLASPAAGLSAVPDQHSPNAGAILAFTGRPALGR